MTEKNSPPAAKTMRKVFDLKSVSHRINEIRELEKKIIDLKKSLVENSATVADAEGGDMSFLLMRVRSSIIAAPIVYIEEAVEMPALERLTEEISTVSGLVNYHGEMIAVIDVAELMGEGKTEITPDMILILCQVPPHMFALLVDEAMEVIKVGSESITISDQVLPGVMRASGIVKVDDIRSATIMDLGWIAMGAHLAELLNKDAATPLNGGEMH